MKLTECPLGRVVIDWPARTMTYRKDEGTAVSVTFKSSTNNSVDLFHYCCAIALAQDHHLAGGNRTEWKGADRGFLDLVVKTFRWKFAPNSREIYWSTLARGKRGAHGAAKIIALDGTGQRDGPSDAQVLFGRIEDFVLGSVRDLGDGRHELWTIEFRNRDDSFAGFRETVLSLLRPHPSGREEEPSTRNAHAHAGPALALPRDRGARESRPLDSPPPVPRDKANTNVPSDDVRRYLIPFDHIIEDRLDGLLPGTREHVVREVRRFLRRSRPASGYFLLNGEPGVGKSSFLAKCISEIGCKAHHFSHHGNDQSTATAFVSHICAQLAVQCGIPFPYQAIGSSVDTALVQTLIAAGKHADAAHPLIIVADALDEAKSDGHEAGNILSLPEDLPPHVFVIASARDFGAIRLRVSNHRPFTLEALKGESERDVQRHVSHWLKSAGGRKWLRTTGQGPEKATEALVKQSGGNFMYLRYVLPVLEDVEEGEYAGLTVDELPAGLMNYYEYHWSLMMRGQDRRLQARVIYYLTMMGEVSCGTLSGCLSENPQVVQDVLDAWRPFLHREVGEQYTLYSLYHQSFSDFLMQKETVKAAGLSLSRIDRDVDAWIDKRLRCR